MSANEHGTLVHLKNRRGGPEAIDPRIVFRAYAAVASVLGIVLIGWGPMWFGAHLPGMPWANAVLIRMCGAVVLSAACCAAAFATVDHILTRRRVLGWFAAAHLIVAFTVVMQRVVVFGVAVFDTLNLLLMTISLVLLYLWLTAFGERRPSQTAITTVFGSPSVRVDHAVSAEIIRSRYEQEIREAASQEERNRLARDLHDSIKQQMFVIQTAAATVEARFDEDRSGAREALAQVRASAREAMSEMEAMLDQLRAVPLENAGLVASLKKQCEALGYRTGAKVDFVVGTLPPNEALAPGAQRAIFRVAQEALANVGRHARASHVGVSLGTTDRGLELRIEDDGVGFEPGQSHGGMGLANIAARAHDYGGNLTLESRRGGKTTGTMIRMSVPIQNLSSELDRHHTLMRIAIWSFFLASALISLAMRELDLSVAIGAVAVIGLVRNIAAYFRLRQRRTMASFT